VPFLVVSCGGHAAPNTAVPASRSLSLPRASAVPVPNSTKLQAEVLGSPVSKVSLYFAAPELGARVTNADPRDYRVHVISDAVGSDVAGIELALDAGRPRRISVDDATILLGQLLSADADLLPGAHWLFAAPILASGLVPRVAPGGLHAAKARRFFVGNAPGEAPDPGGAVWLRKPEGSYNGAKQSEAVLFEAIVFSPLGAPIDIPCTITLRAPGLGGRLQLPSPFVLRDVPSGVYEVTASAPAASSSMTYFTVNRELAGGS
jgi:hypothetical protein